MLRFFTVGLMVAMFGPQAEAAGLLTFQTNSVGAYAGGFDLYYAGREAPESPPFYQIEIPHFTSAIQNGLRSIGQDPTLIEVVINLSIDFVAGFGFDTSPLTPQQLQGTEQLSATLSSPGFVSDVTPAAETVPIDDPVGHFAATLSYDLPGLDSAFLESANQPIDNHGFSGDFVLIPSPDFRGVYTPDDQIISDKSAISNVNASVTYIFVPEPAGFPFLVVGASVSAIARLRFRSRQR